MAIIDFHSHILPAIDDGSNSVEQSLHMYHMSAAQGTEIIAATPHFYASSDQVEDFLSRRERAYYSLCAELEKSQTASCCPAGLEKSQTASCCPAGLEKFQTASCCQTGHEKSQTASCMKAGAESQNPALPHIRLGAEVSYFPGISQANKLSRFTFEGTRLLLLELPFEEWKETVISEIEILAEVRGFEIMLAHLERYLQISGNIKKIEQILELPVHVQINAGGLLDWRRRRKVLKLFRKSKSHVLGSDMHGTKRRPPNLMEGRAVLEKKFGAAFLNEMDAAAEILLNS